MGEKSIVSVLGEKKGAKEEWLQGSDTETSPCQLTIPDDSPHSPLRVGRTWGLGPGGGHWGDGGLR